MHSSDLPSSHSLPASTVTADEVFPRRILLAVTGLSPQVVTETLYALTRAGHAHAQFCPTEIHLLTTAEGARRAHAALLHPDGGQFHALLADYPDIGRPRFDASSVHVIGADQGQALDDIRTPEENALAADAITRLVAALTSDPMAALHASIAGGRKTMGFYLGYAFSLYARPQDRLSHVLVSSPFENHSEFFFPPAQRRRLATRDGAHLDTADAKVTLAIIPVVRLRHGMPKDLLDGRVSFNQAVAAVQDSFTPPLLRISLQAKSRAWCGLRELALPPMQLAWLAWWALLTKKGIPWQEWRNAPYALFLEIYRKLTGPDSDAPEKTSERIAGHGEKEFFYENNAKLQRALREQLGTAATPYLLGQLGRRGHVQRGLALSPEAIELHGFDRWLASET